MTRLLLNMITGVLDRAQLEKNKTVHGIIKRKRHLKMNGWKHKIPLRIRRIFRS